MGSNRVILVHVDFAAERPVEEDLQEFQELARSAGVEVVAIITGKRAGPAAKYLIGSGKAKEIADLVANEEVDLVIFNHELTPAQERNLEITFECRVLDRTGLILDIFAQRARSFEGSLQVELAQLQHLSTRLVRGWSHLERQKGGIGLRGPGETQLEVDRRLIRNRIKMINKRLAKVRMQRAQQRRARKRKELITVSLVGYTNAGKSTLFNRLTTADVHAADQLFATLDPTLRRVELPDIGNIILVDTVGFIRHLPHDLVEAFHATLEESAEADLLLHVVDAHDPERREKMLAVNTVLEEISADNIPQLIVYNKIDLLEGKEPRIDYHENGDPKAVRISAQNDIGINLLLDALHKLLTKDIREYDLVLNSSQGQLRAKLYEHGLVVSEAIDEEGNYLLHVRMSPQDYGRFIN